MTGPERAADARVGRIVAAGLIGAAVAAVFARVLWHLGDEGSVINGAQRWASGQLPYRDFFEVMGPLTFVPGMLAFWALGEHWWVSRIEMIIAITATAVLLCWLAGRHLPAGRRDDLLVSLMYIVSLVPLWPGVNYHVDANAAYLGATALALGPWRHKTVWAISGALAAYVTFVMLQKGVILSCVLVLSCLLDRQGSRSQRFTSAAIVMAAFFMCVAAVLFYFWIQGGLNDLAYATVVWPIANYHEVNQVPLGHGFEEVCSIVYALWGRPLGPVVGAALTTWLVAPVVLVIVLAVVGFSSLMRAVIRKTLRTPGQVTLLLAGGGLLLSELHRPDIMHLLYGAPLLMLAGHDTVQAWLANHRQRGIVFGLVRASVVSTLATTLVVPLSARTAVDTRAGPVHLIRDDAALDYLTGETSFGEKLFVYPYLPMYYFVGGIRNPTRYSIFMYGINTPAQAYEIVADLDRQCVSTVLWDAVYSGDGLGRWFNYREPSPDQQIVETYLRRHFDVYRIAGNFRVLKRKRNGDRVAPEASNRDSVVPPVSSR